MGKDGSIVHKNYLNILHLNCLGLRSNLFQETHTDITTTNKIHLPANQHLNFPGYHIFRQDHLKQGPKSSSWYSTESFVSFIYCQLAVSPTCMEAYSHFNISKTQQTSQLHYSYRPISLTSAICRLFEKNLIMSYSVCRKAFILNTTYMTNWPGLSVFYPI